MFIGQRSAASMSAPVYTQIKWLKSLSIMERITHTVAPLAKLWQHKPIYQTFHKNLLLSMNHSFICFSAPLLSTFMICPSCHQSGLRALLCSALLLLQIPFSVNIQELTHILRATYFSSQVANRKEKQGHGRVGSSNGCALVNPTASLRYLLKSWPAWLMARWNHYDRLCQQNIY